MSNFLKRIFCPDWMVIESFKGQGYYYERTPSVEVQNYFEIEYSEVRNKYRLMCYGHNKVSDPQYEVANQKLIEYNKNKLKTKSR